MIESISNDFTDEVIALDDLYQMYRFEEGKAVGGYHHFVVNRITAFKSADVHGFDVHGARDGVQELIHLYRGFFGPHHRVHFVTEFEPDQVECKGK